MAEPINLNKARKAQAQKSAQAQAVENRVKFGRTKAQKALDKTRSDKSARDLDAGKRER